MLRKNCRRRSWVQALALLLVLHVSLIGSVQAQEGTGLFRSAQQLEGDRVSVHVDFAKIKPTTVQMQSAKQQKSAPGVPAVAEASFRGDSRIEAALPDRTVVLKKKQINVRGTDKYTWSGTVEGEEGSAAVLTVENGVLVGTISVDGDNYSIRPEGEAYVVEKKDPAKTAPLADDALFPPGFERSQDAPAMAPAAPSVAAAAPSVPPDDGAVQDIMVLYTLGMQAKYGSGIPAFVQHTVDYANMTYANSQVNTRLRLVHAQLITDADLQDTIKINSALDALIANAKIGALRDTYKADLVTLIRVYQWDGTAGGLGYVQGAGYGNGDPSFANLALNVVADTEEHLLAHEVGHNQGCHHDRRTGCSGAFSFSCGYKIEGVLSTVMSYYGVRAPFFSNPAIYYKGYPTGVVEGQPDSADNARTINITRQVTANFRNSNATYTSTQVAAGPNPSTVGQQITLTATVTPSTATGTVTFYDGGASLGTGTLAGGKASLTTSALAAGSHTLRAAFAGGGVFVGSTSPAIPQTVNAILASTTTTVASSPNPSTQGQAVALQATVSPNIATGTVTFYDGVTSLGKGTLAGGTATLSTSALGTGSRSIKAVYSGDAKFTGSSAVLTHAVNPLIVPTTTALTSSPSPSVSGQAVILKATVAPSTATGTVTFFDGSTSLGTATLASGIASLSTQALTAGSHSLKAIYGGDSKSAGSTSADITHTVNQVTVGTTTTTVTASPNPSTAGQAIALKATVSPATATGTVTFYGRELVVNSENSAGATILAPLGTGTLAAGSASLSTSNLSGAGTYEIRAVYGGDGQFAGSTSADITHSVNQAMAIAAPSNAAAAATSLSSIKVSWLDNSANEAGFRLERSDAGAGWHEIANLQANATSYSDSGLTPATAYEYRLRAYTTGGDPSNYSNVATATTPKDSSVARMLLSNTTGQVQIWSLDAANTLLGSKQYGPYSGWTAMGYQKDRDGSARILWKHTSGQVSIWKLDSADKAVVINKTYGPYAGWTPVEYKKAQDGTARLLWKHASGQVVIWKLDAADNYLGSKAYGPYDGWSPINYEKAPDGSARLLWKHTSGQISLWKLDAADNRVIWDKLYGPYSGWTPIRYNQGPDQTGRLLWKHSSGLVASWKLDASNNYVSSKNFGSYPGWTPINYELVQP